MVPNLFGDGSLWESVTAVTPPPFFDPDIGFVFATDAFGAGPSQINFIGDDTELPGVYRFSLHVSANGGAALLYVVLRYTIVATPVTVPYVLGTLPTGLDQYDLEFSLPDQISGFSLEISRDVGGGIYLPPNSMTATLLAQPDTKNGPAILNGGSSDYDRSLCYNAPVDYNSGQFVNPETKTLAQLRQELLERLGYAAQGFPPGMSALLTSFLQDAQEQLYWRYPVLHTERWFGWQTVVGERFYDVPIDCTKYLNFRKITWAGLQDDQAWFPLVGGINPLLFNQTMNSLPQYYELREFLEIWPAPDKASYVIWLKGHIGLMPFAADDDVTTIDSRPVFLTALANAKAHYGQPDANNYFRQCEVLIGRLNAGTHITKRYIPGENPRVGMPLPIREVPGG